MREATLAIVIVRYRQPAGYHSKVSRCGKAVVDKRLGRQPTVWVACEIAEFRTPSGFPSDSQQVNSPDSQFKNKPYKFIRIDDT